jgi:hypothetical protein
VSTQPARRNLLRWYELSAAGRLVLDIDGTATIGLPFDIEVVEFRAIEQVRLEVAIWPSRSRFG